jgi:hypothetical protein
VEVAAGSLRSCGVASVAKKMTPCDGVVEDASLGTLALLGDVDTFRSI